MNYKIKKEEILLELPSNSLIAVLVGHHSINLAKLEKLIDVNINLFGNQFNISGNAENINKAKLIISNWDWNPTKVLDVITDIKYKFMPKSPKP